ncbi:hypothetical protein BU586_11155 [Staphylococcus agnetis]|uniref:hypothetical protein n=1 Tax=Staphylococcus TaxID=1279 RepID=UPI000D1A48E1|nr:MULTISPECIES: hypothetical protein [Staphylococcus]MCO4357967.1 hypothetical protein [Staphylococcus agnetis]MCO4363319.1 hypothetical protein [Staphylococcus agnetis]NHM74101.1 hypothetical protein [Staphylococcus sp. 11007852]NJH79274.1 hypothetical protein [Staphylococcus agnetis]NJH83766.1 hypothetical protein [Staphylococcus agnetis]
MLDKLKIKKYLEVIKTLTRRNLLTIKVKDVNSVPEVIYKGKKLKYKKNVIFSWETAKDHMYSNGYDVEIEHYVKGPIRRPGRCEKLGFKSPFKD